MSEEGTPHKRRGVVDIVFLIDATGSMEECIDALKANVNTLVNSISERSQQNPVKDWRAKVVGFRDFLDTAYEPLVDNPFVKEPVAISSQLAALKAMGKNYLRLRCSNDGTVFSLDHAGPCDVCEELDCLHRFCLLHKIPVGGGVCSKCAREPASLLDAIYHVANMGQTDKSAQELDPNKWRYRSHGIRVVIIFADATYHPTTKEGGTLDDITLACTGNRILLFIFAPELDCYDKLAEIDKSEYEAIEIMGGESAADALARFTKQPEAFKLAMEQLGKSVSASAAVEVL